MRTSLTENILKDMETGAESDPLYAKAISLISGNEVTTPTRAVNQAKEQMLVIATPRLNRIGMIK